MDLIKIAPEVTVKLENNLVSFHRSKKLVTTWSFQERKEVESLIDLLKSRGISEKEFLLLSFEELLPLRELITHRLLILEHPSIDGAFYITESFLQKKKNLYKAKTLLITEESNSFTICSPFSGVELKLKRNSATLQDLFNAKTRKSIQRTLKVKRKITSDSALSYLFIEKTLQKKRKTQYESRSTIQTYSSTPIDLTPSNFFLEKEKLESESFRDFSKQDITYTSLANFLFFVASYRLDRFTKKEKPPYPSAGGIYESDIFVAINRVEGLAPGLYIYSGKNRTLTPIHVAEDILDELKNHSAIATMSSVAPNVSLWFSSDVKALIDSYHNVALPLSYMNIGVIIDRCYLASKHLNLLGTAIGRGEFSIELQNLGILSEDQFLIAGYAL